MKKVLALFLASIFCLSFAGCANNSNNAKVSDTVSATINTTQTENCWQDSDIFTAFENKFYQTLNVNGQILINEVDDKGTVVKKLALFDASNHSLYNQKLFSLNNTVYFTFINCKSNLKRELYTLQNGKFVKLTEFKLVSEPYSTAYYDIYPYSDGILYSDGIQVYKTDFYGKNSKVIIKSQIDNSGEDGLHHSINFAVADNKIYFSYSGQGLFISDLAGNSIKQIDSVGYQGFKLYNSSVYCLTEADDNFRGNLCVISNDKINTLIKNIHFFSYYACDKNIYYTVQDDSKDGVSGNTNKLYRCNINGNSAKLIYENKKIDNMRVLAICNNKLIMTSPDNNSDDVMPFSINLDGTGYGQLG